MSPAPRADWSPCPRSPCPKPSSPRSSLPPRAVSTTPTQGARPDPAPHTDRRRHVVRALPSKGRKARAPHPRVAHGPHRSRRPAARQTVIGSVADGQSPQAIRRTAAGALSFEALADRYSRVRKTQQGSWETTKAISARSERWKGRTAESIARADVVALLEQIRTTAPVSANRTRPCWYCSAGRWRPVVETNPAAGVKARAERPRASAC